MAPPRRIPFLTSADIRGAATMLQAIAAVKDAFIQLSTGRAVIPTRTSLEIPEFGTTALVMPAYLPSEGLIGLKLISLVEKNPERGRPLAQAVVIVMDAETGSPVAMLDGAYLTALRTGAASGAATEVLARPEARTVAIFGAGVQGRAQLEAISVVRPIDRAVIVDPDEEKARRFAEEMSDRISLKIEVAGASAALGQADIICTATTSSTPVFDDADLRPGGHINAVGSYKPHLREIPEGTVLRAKVIVDRRGPCLEEAGDLIIPIAKGLIHENHITAELGEVLAGIKPGRTSRDEITLFKSVGNAVQDLAVASLVLKNIGWRTAPARGK